MQLHFMDCEIFTLLPYDLMYESTNDSCFHMGKSVICSVSENIFAFPFQLELEHLTVWVFVSDAVRQRG